MNINPVFCGSANDCKKMTQWDNNILKKTVVWNLDNTVC